MKEKELSFEDVEKIKQDTSGKNRAQAAEIIAKNLNDERFTEKEKDIANEIFRLMVKDTQVLVRETLAKNLKENNSIPHDIALSLAKDVASVSLPILQCSDVLTEEDLINIVKEKDKEEQEVIASRKNISEKVSEAIVENAKTDKVVAALVLNETAKISEKTFDKVLDKYKENKKINEKIVYRSSIPVKIAEKLVVRVSEELQKYLVTHHELPEDTATDLVMQTRERATVTLSMETNSEESIKELVEQLNDNGRLTPSIIFRAICMGDVRFFEYALSIAAKVPIENARKLINESGSLGFKGLYEKAGQPGEMYTAASNAIKIIKELQPDLSDPQAKEKLSRRIIECILSNFSNPEEEMESDDLDYLLTKINSLPVNKVNASE